MASQGAMTDCDPLTAFPSISDREFTLFQELIHREAGIFLSKAKKALVVARLAKRLRELGISSFSDYYAFVTRGEGGEFVRMLDSICTNETRFFRDPRQFELIETTYAASVVRQNPSLRKFRVWSAACSTGEEPYSLAMSLLSTLPDDWSLEIVATDLSTKALDKARAGVWPVSKSEFIPSRHLKRFMMRGVRSQQGQMAAAPDLRRVITFSRMNLNDNEYPVQGSFNVIFCRNVLIYFNHETKKRVIARLLERLEPGGFIFLGHAESMNGISEGVVSVGPNIYSKPVC